MEAGRDLGIRNAGHSVLDGLRIERLIPQMGKEMTSFVTPREAGVMDRVQLDKVIMVTVLINQAALKFNYNAGICFSLLYERSDPATLRLSSSKKYWSYGLRKRLLVTSKIVRFFFPDVPVSNSPLILAQMLSPQWGQWESYFDPIKTWVALRKHRERSKAWWTVPLPNKGRKSTEENRDEYFAPQHQ